MDLSGAAGAAGVVRSSPDRHEADLQFLGSDAELLHLLSLHGRARPPHLRAPGMAQNVEDAAPVDIGLPSLVAGPDASALGSSDPLAATGAIPSGYDVDVGTTDPVGFAVAAEEPSDDFAAAAVVDNKGLPQRGGPDMDSLVRLGPSGALEVPLSLELGRFLAEPIGEVTAKELQERRWGGFDQSLEVRANAAAEATPHERAGDVRASVTALRATCVSLHRRVRELGYLAFAATDEGREGAGETGAAQTPNAGGPSDSKESDAKKALRSSLMQELASALQLSDEQKQRLGDMQSRVLATRRELKPLCGAYQALRGEGVHGFRGAEALHDLLRSTLEPEKAKTLMQWVSRLEGKTFSTDRRGRPLPPHVRLGAKSFRPDYAQLGKALDESAYSKLQKRGGGVSARTSVAELLDLARRRGRPGQLAREAAESQLGRALASIALDEPYGRIVPSPMVQQLAAAPPGGGTRPSSGFPHERGVAGFGAVRPAVRPAVGDRESGDRGLRISAPPAPMV